MTVLYFIVGIIFAISAGISLVMSTYARGLRLAKRKHHIEPKVNYPEDGICQCGDAFCYHAGSMGCQVANCPCQMFVPSTLKNEDIEQMTVVQILARTAQLELETVTHQEEAARKRKQLERGY